MKSQKTFVVSIIILLFAFLCFSVSKYTEKTCEDDCVKFTEEYGRSNSEIGTVPNQTQLCLFLA